MHLANAAPTILCILTGPNKLFGGLQQKTEKPKTKATCGADRTLKPKMQIT